ncbi:hypothetical protein ASPZODRAFT_148165 [Penicilliopsis zonata CBS 506.65]|uniref:Aminoglycoside phosphotransferase domain-containing protein n=1 Tax=Penicilliopsis zonata CBS 506.65 TaxID=1073090 RepID=A0A1L9SU60_9EURO|nr:hypothetical protein ASPZODRAFT_148165 [Penicilliopsis zonata CBS 506.65]OJJ50729.1 hypothetical protein ASPZODRAFT_148165 [Penicilliopsis zonata CBS 506.65]
MDHDSTIRDEIAHELTATPFACSSLIKLSGGTANFVYRGVLAEQPDKSVVVKHTKDYAASNTALRLDAARCKFEAAIIESLHELPPLSLAGLTVHTPRLLHFSTTTLTQIVEDLPHAVDLKSYLLSEQGRTLSQPIAHALGRVLGAWLRSFHTWGKDDAPDVAARMQQNMTMKKLKHHVNYGFLLETINNFPHLLEGSRNVFTQVTDMAAAELDIHEGEMYGLIHGDFWTGNILVSTPLTRLFVVDWELVHVGHRALDLGQMIAELYETTLFKDVTAGEWIVQGFAEGYGPLSDAMAFRTALHVGTHLVCWGSRVPGWGTPKQIEQVVERGRDFILRGWEKDRAWFKTGALGCLFTE